MERKIDLYYNPRADLYANMHTMLVIDDDEAVNRMIAMSIVEAYPDTIVLGCLNPMACVALLKELYFDILISDINMPGLRGDKILELVRIKSPTTFTMAMTGHTMDMAFIAGRAQPDFFLDKNKGFDLLIAEISKGILESVARQKKILSAFSPTATPEGAAPHGSWRQRKNLKKSLGFPPRKIERSRGLLKALAALSGLKKMSKEEIAFCAGFSSFQRLKNHLKTISTLVNIPATL